MNEYQKSNYKSFFVKPSLLNALPLKISILKFILIISYYFIHYKMFQLLYLYCNKILKENDVVSKKCVLYTLKYGLTNPWKQINITNGESNFNSILFN